MVVCVAGDGSFQMNSQEMATAAINNVPVKVILFDNRSLGMVHQWQKLFYNKRYSQTLLDDNPDFVKLADAYGWKGARITKASEVKDAIAHMLASTEPYLLDVVISAEQNVYPMVAPGAALDDVMGAIDVAVGAVKTEASSAAQANHAQQKTVSSCDTIDAQFGGHWKADPDDAEKRMNAQKTDQDGE